MQQRIITEFFNSPNCRHSSPSPAAQGQMTPRSYSDSAIKKALVPPDAHSPFKTPTGSTRKRKRISQQNLQQTIIDAGQKRIGLEHCIKCDMVYNVDDVKDVAKHSAFHNRFTETTAFRLTSTQFESWKRCLYSESVSVPVKGFIFRLTNTCPSAVKRKFEEIVESYVNEELGYCDTLPIWDDEGLRQALVFVSELAVGGGGESTFIGGLTLIDRIEEVMLMPQQKSFRGQFLGVNRIWVHSQLRRRGLAAHLLDCVRRLMVSGGVLPRSRIAFSEPTEAGVQLAISYIGDKENGSKYIVYALNLPMLTPPPKKTKTPDERDAMKNIRKRRKKLLTKTV